MFGWYSGNNSVEKPSTLIILSRNQNTLGHVETSNLKNTGVVRRRTVFGVEPYTRIYAWASNLSRVYNSITALNLDLIFPTEPTFECNIAHIALRAALASIASLTAIISSQYKPQRLPLGGLHQPYLLQVHGRLESLLASSAPIFVISSAAYFGATILLHHYQSHDPYQNLFIIAGALCGLLFDIRSENWVSIGRNVPIFIAIAMILSIVRYGFSETFPTLRASKLSIGQELRRQFVVGHMGGLRSLVGLKRGSDSLPWTDADC